MRAVNVGPIAPDSGSGCGCKARCRSPARRDQLRIDREHPRIARANHAYRGLQLLGRDSVEVYAGVVTVDGVVAVGTVDIADLCGAAALYDEDGAERPPSRQTIDQSTAIK